MIRSGLLTAFAIFMAVVMACAPSAAPDSAVHSPQGPTATPSPTNTPTPPPTIPDEIRNFTPPSPMPEGRPGRATGDHGYLWRDRVPVVQGTPLEMPDCAINDGLVAKAQSFPIVIDGETIEPLQLPIYQIIRNGEIANISKTTGRFTIGENQKDTFQFLIDQLGADKMQLLPDEYYEEEWSPYRQKALDEGC